MAKGEKFTNRARGVLEGAIDNAVTTLALETGDGAVFPSDGNFRIRVEDEIMLVGARSGDTLSSITRGYEGTAAASHADGVEVTHPLTAGAVVLAHAQSRFGGRFIHPSEFSLPVALYMPWSGRFTAWDVLNDRSGSVEFDVWVDDYASYPPTVADTITASDRPKTTSAIKAAGSCTGWTVDFLAGDVVYIVCLSGQSVHASTVLLTAVRSV